jgi:hypothetical protein
MSETPDILFTRSDVLTLTQKLGKFAAENPLTKGEWGLLLAVFAAAANHAEIGKDRSEGKFSGVKAKGDVPTVDDPAGKTPAELREQLRRAYIPGRAPVPPLDIVTPPGSRK